MASMAGCCTSSRGARAPGRKILRAVPSAAVPQLSARGEDDEDEDDIDGMERCVTGAAEATAATATVAATHAVTRIMVHLWENGTRGWDLRCNRYAKRGEKKSPSPPAPPSSSPPFPLPPPMRVAWRVGCRAV